MEVTAAERYASGGPARELHAQNLALAFEATVDRIRRRPGDRRGSGRRRGPDHLDRAPRAGRRGSPAGSPSSASRKGDTVAIMLNNRPEFIPIDLAAVSLGGGAVLDLPDLLAGADPVRGLRRRGEGRDRRSGVPRGLQQGARGAARSSRR